jgi:hypothetical protein
MPIAGDQRAWDATISKGRATCAVEAETNLRDIQAIERRIALKKRDAGLDVVILLVRDTRWNRHAVQTWNDLLRTSFPGDRRGGLSRLRAGELSEQSAVIFL